MKPWKALSSALISLILALPASARHACVSLSDLEDAPFSDRTVSPSVARLLLAQRLGLSKYHSFGDVDEDAIELLNSYGSYQEAQDDRQKVVVFIEGVEEPDILAQKHHSSAYKIDNPPSPDASVRLLEDFSKQSHHLSRSSRHTCQRGEFDIPSALKNEKSRTTGCYTYLHATLDQPHTGSLTTSNIHSTLSSLRASASSSSADLITVFIPPISSSSLFKRSTPPQSWGSSNLARQAPGPSDPGDSNSEAAEPSSTHASGLKDILEDLEEIFDEESSALPEPTRPTIADDDDTPKRPIKDKLAASSSGSSAPVDTSAPKGILPQCYTSESDCKKRTHHCSGHGSCQLKYDLSHPSSLKNRNDPVLEMRQDRPGSKVSTKTKCYACVCGITSRVDDQNRNKTTQWAGPACQKKDVSVPFWLLGGTTVGLVGIVGWGVGLLYGMGSQELPSVIGAGVAGLGARGK